MVSKAFVGRERELEHLASLYKRKISSLVVLKGRRRVGKSRLVSYFSSQCTKGRFFSFSGLAPQSGGKAQVQRNHFSKQLSVILGQPEEKFLDWSDALDFLSKHLEPGDIVLFDEISWMGSGDPSFVPKLKFWWDKQVISFFLVFCGSVSIWIEENILKSTAFYGRINLTITLEPLTIPESSKLLRILGFKGSVYEIFILLSILGGIPWYLEQVKPGYSIDDIIQALCFEKDGLLVVEFDRIFNDLFNGKGLTYKKILNILKNGTKTLSHIREEVGYSNGGALSSMLENLIIAGFVKKQKLWSFKTTKSLKQSLYYICDPYMRFYLKLIEPKRDRIDAGKMQKIQVSKISGFGTHMGLQLEQLLMQNSSLLLKKMGVLPMGVIADGPFRQIKTTKQAGCQIDYLVQTETKNIFICEFKFMRSELGIEVIQQMEKKMQALAVPRGFAVLPVLFHIGGVSVSVELSNYFYRIIDISDLLGEV